jgi:hypothetical protein
MRSVLVVRAVVVVVAALAVAGVVASAVRTFVVPRALPVALSRTVFVALRWVFSRSVRRARSYEALDRRMAYYAPTSLLALPIVWLSIVLGAFAVMYWSIDQQGWWSGLETSGSSLLTLGFRHPGSRPTTLLSFAEAGIGLALVALLITYLPTIYGGFSRRETFVSLMEGRAGNPPWAVTMLLRYQAIGLLDRTDELWERAELWFADLEESHSSLASLVFFRSPQPSRSWVTAAGAVLDGAALSLSVLDLPNDPHAALCIRAGFLCLRRIADFFGIAHPADPSPTDPISISRDEFDAAVDRLGAAGTPIKPDLEQAWRDFQGWRVNYDTVLLDLAALTDAPLAPWSSDRSPPYHRPPVVRWRKRP